MEGFALALDFDFVLIDTKPQINVLLQSALCASHWYTIPSFPEPDSYDGFLDLVAECEEIYEEMNEDLNCLGVLMTCVKRIPAHESYLKFNIRDNSYFRAGRYYRDYSRYLNDELSSGSILISNNAQAMPKIGVVSKKKLKR